MGAFTETIEHWVSEYLVSTEGELQARAFGARAAGVLVAFFENACGGHVHPSELEKSNIPDGVGIGLLPLALDEDEKSNVPDLLESCLTWLETSGRLADGTTLGAYARTTASAHLLKRPTRRKTIKVGPNEPCPCGSGLKYKKCCMHL